MLKAFITNFGATLISTGLSTIAVFLLVRNLSPADWGVSASTLGIGQLLGAILSFGTQIERVRRYSSMTDETRRLQAKTDASARNAIATLSGLIGLIVLVFAPDVGAVVIAAAGTYASLAATNYFVAAKQFVKAGLVLAAEKSLLLALVSTALVIAAPGSLVMPVAQGVAGLTTALVSSKLIRVHAPKLSLKEHVRRLQGQYRSGIYLGLASLAPSFLLLDATIVILISGREEAASFALAARLVSPLTIATTALVAVLMPFLISPAREARGSNAQALVVLTLGYFASLAVLAVSASWWVPMVFGEAYASSILAVQLYIGNAFMVFFTRVLATVSQARGEDKIISVLIGSQVIAALVGIAIGAGLAGSSGAAISLVSTNAVLALVLGGREWARRKARSV